MKFTDVLIVAGAIVIGAYLGDMLKLNQLLSGFMRPAA